MDHQRLTNINVKVSWNKKNIGHVTATTPMTSKISDIPRDRHALYEPKKKQQNLCPLFADQTQGCHIAWPLFVCLSVGLDACHLLYSSSQLDSSFNNTQASMSNTNNTSTEHQQVYLLLCLSQILSLRLGLCLSFFFLLLL